MRSPLTFPDECHPQRVSATYSDPMPPLPSPGQVVKLDFNYVRQDAAATNILYYSYSGAGALSPSELSAFANSATQTSVLESPYIGASPDTENGVVSQYVDLVNDMGAEQSETYGWVGTNTGSDVPSSASVIVRKTILRHYRGGHPRTYMMVGTGADFVTGSTKFWQAAFLANIQAGWDSYLAAFPLTIGSRTWNPVSVSYWETVGGVRQLRATPLVDLIVGYNVESRVCSQRRRLGKVGG